MLNQIRNVYHRSQDTLVQDVLGAAALVVMLLVALHMPGLI